MDEKSQGKKWPNDVYVVVNFLSLFLGMLMYANGVETKEK